MREVIYPSDPRVVALFASDLAFGTDVVRKKSKRLNKAGQPMEVVHDRAKRTYYLRLVRAIKRGLLPDPVYISSQRWGWYLDELEAKVGQLPRNYADVPAMPPKEPAHQAAVA